MLLPKRLPVIHSFNEDYLNAKGDRSLRHPRPRDPQPMLPMSKKTFGYDFHG